MSDNNGGLSKFNPLHYLYASIPVPILHSDLSSVTKLIYASYFSAEKLRQLNGRSVSQTARDLRISRSTVVESMNVLERRGFISRKYVKNSSGGETVYVFVSVPVECQDDRWLYKPSREERTVPHTVPKKGECTVPHTVPPLSERRTPPVRTADTPLSEGRTPHCPRGGHPPVRRSDSNKSIKREEEREEREYERLPLDDSAESSRLEGDPTSTGTVNLDEDSPEARDVLELQRVQRVERRETRLKRPRVRKVTEVQSGEEFRDTPSSRPEWNAWRDKNAASWIGRDLVGFWVCRFREVRGAEDPDFTAASVSVGYAPAAMRLVKQFVSLNLGSAVKYRDLVERVLAEAEALGRPVSLRYWFGTPSNPRTLASLDKGRGGREMSPAERNDLDGANLELHERRGREWYERQLEKDREDAAVGR